MNALLRSIFCVFAFGSLLLLPQTAQAQVTRYVSTTGTNANPATATSWATSTTNLQGAIAASSPGDQVWVGSGTYKPTGTPDRTISFQMKNGVAIYGGFVGTETALNQRPAVNPVLGNPSSTTLSGDIGTPIDPADNSYHVVSNRGNTLGGLTASAVLDGFVITGGNANVTNTVNPNENIDNCGGGVYNGAFGGTCTPTIRNCLFQNNFALFGAAMGNDGFGLGTASPVVTNCLFQNNTAFLSGGALFNNGNQGTASPQLTNCLFRTNRASPSAATPTTSGGAIYNFGAQGTSSPVLTNCGFLTNRASLGGAMYNDARSGISQPLVTNCAFQSNSATTGWAMHNDGAATGVSRPALANSVFWNNGGANTFSNTEASITTAYCLFESTVTGYNAGTGNLTNASTSPFESTSSIELATGSAAINAGNPASITVANGPYSATQLPTTDLLGNLRIVQNRVDMGAVEYTIALLTAASPNPVCAGSPGAPTTVALSVTASQGTLPYSYTWAAPAGITLSGTSTSAVSAAIGAGVSGLQTLTVTVADAASGTPLVNVGLVSLLVNARPAATLASTSGTVLGCARTTLALTATGGAPYTFSRVGGGAGIVSQNSTQGTATVNAPGTYSVVATSPGGCTASAGIVITQDLTLPGATLTANFGGTLTCAQTSLTLTATGNGAYAFSRVGGGGIVTQNALAGTAVVNASGTYSVTVTNTQTGCFSTTTTTVFSNTTAPNVSIAPTSGTLTCTSPSLTLTASGTGTSYRWTGGSTGPTLAVNTAGTYSVTALGANGCTAVSSATISSNQTVPSAPALSGASLSVTASPTPLSLTTLVTATGSNTLTFSNSNGIVDPPVANISAAGVQTFSVVQTNPAGCVSPATVFSLTVLSPLPPGSQSACRGSNVVLNVLPTGTRYQWFRHASLTSPGARLPEVASLYLGTTTASLTLVSVQTTGYYSCQVTQANGTALTYGPYTVTVNLCGGREAATEPPVPITIQVWVAPNPVTNNTLRATITGAGGQRLTVSLTDPQGRIVREQQWQAADEPQRIEWSVGTLPTGTLLLRATTERSSQTVKVLKE